MMSPKAELQGLVRSLEERTESDRSHVSVSEVRAIVAKTIRVTHQLLHPNCGLGTSNHALRLALVDLDKGSPLPRIAI